MRLHLLSADVQREIRESFLRISQSPLYADVRDSIDCVVDLRYGSDRNFMSLDVYGGLNRCFLHRDAISMLQVAAAKLAFMKSGTKLFIFDGLRPASAQKVLWSYVAGTSQEKYIANPERGSIHSYGLAVDLSLVDEQGVELDMGTVFDHFDELAEPRHEERFLAEGLLTERQLQNRHLLREVMLESGFHMVPHEWWHFDAFPREDVRRNYPLVP